MFPDVLCCVSAVFGWREKRGGYSNLNRKEGKENGKEQRGDVDTELRDFRKMPGPVVAVGAVHFGDVWWTIFFSKKGGYY